MTAHNAGCSAFIKASVPRELYERFCYVASLTDMSVAALLRLLIERTVEEFEAAP